MKERKPSRRRGWNYPPRVCIDCARWFAPKRVDGSSLRRRCDECFEVWRKGLAMRGDER